jgi:CYTH domain-containing protein
MALEIERKFLVNGEFRSDVAEAVHIIQVYFNAAWSYSKDTYQR